MRAMSRIGGCSIQPDSVTFSRTPTRAPRRGEAAVPRPAGRGGRAPALAGHAAVGAGVGALGRWHRHVNPYSEPWWTYMDWMPTRPGPVISARYMPRLISPVFTFCWTAFMVTVESLYRKPPGS